MKPETARTLVIAASICLVIGLLALSPAAQFLLAVLAVLVAAAPAASGTRALRIAALAVIVLSLFMAAVSFPSFRSEQQHYRERASKTR